MPTNRQCIAELTKLAEDARRAKDATNAGWRAKLRDTSPSQYQDLLDVFHTAVTHATPSCQPGFAADLASGRPDAVDTAIAFLEADPWFFRSGYEKQRLIRDLKRVALTPEQQGRLRAVVLARIDGHDRHEIRHYGRLAVALVTEEFVDEIITRAGSPNPDIARRAVWMLEVLQSANKS
jgi:hypothetical protein